MPRPKGSFKTTPDYCHHKASGKAYVTLSGKAVYLGDYGTADSIVELIAAYWRHAQSYYATPETGGDSNGELSCLRLALGVVKRLYADTAVSDFGPLALKAVRQEMGRLGWARSHVNRQIHRVRRMFRWGVENEMVPPSILHGLLAVSALRRGKTEAREPEPVRPVTQAHVHPVKDHVARQVWGMIELQLLTGMRPGEVTRMRTGDIDTTGQPWVYRPVRHKTRRRGPRPRQPRRRGGRQKSSRRHPDEPADHALGRGRGGFGSKFHLVTDGKGTPLAAEVSAGQVHESTRLESVVATSLPPGSTGGGRSPASSPATRLTACRRAGLAEGPRHRAGDPAQGRRAREMGPGGVLRPPDVPPARGGRAVRRLAEGVPPHRHPVREAGRELPWACSSSQ